MLRKNVKSLLEQLEVCIFAEIVLGARCTLSPSFDFVATHLWVCVDRSTVRVNSLVAQQNSTNPKLLEHHTLCTFNLNLQDFS